MTEKRKYKVSKSLSGPKAYRKWEDWAVGDTVIGKYTGNHTDQYKKVCPILLVEQTFWKDKNDGEEMEGKSLVLNHCGTLAKAMESVSEGQIIQLEYTGTAEIQKGPYAGKDAHTMKVDIVVEDDSSEEEVDL